MCAGLCLLLGWRTVLHYGSLMGAYSLITLLPDIQLGIFSSYNGAIQTDPYTINSLLHVHLIDLLIGVQPSVDNASYWRDLLAVSHAYRPHTPGSPLYPSSAYEGIYWHAVLGQFEVWADDDTGTLMARYGSLETRLQPLQSGLKFVGLPTDASWSMLIDSVTVEFADVNRHQRCDHVSVKLIHQTVFKRRDDDQRSVAALQTVSTTSAATALVSVIIISNVRRLIT